MNQPSSFDYAKLLSGVDEPPPAVAARREVTEAELLRKAEEMAKRGYGHSVESLAALRDWMEGRGLILGGGVGVGKTFFFRCLQFPLKQLEGDYGGTINVWPMPLKVAAACDGRELLDEMEGLECTELVLDDVGAEPTFNDFGSRFEVFPILVEARLGSKAKTHFTTNLTAEELVERYGQRTVDRMHELAAAHVFGGKSRRQTRIHGNSA